MSSCLVVCSSSNVYRNLNREVKYLTTAVSVVGMIKRWIVNGTWERTFISNIHLHRMLYFFDYRPMTRINIIGEKRLECLESELQTYLATNLPKV